MKNTFKAKLIDLQPSQLYICAEKLSLILGNKATINSEDVEPIPVKKLGSHIIFTDGHTRAYALFKSGITEVYVYWDTDELDWMSYQLCVDWCTHEGIRSIADLEGRVIPEKDYEDLWLNRCALMHKNLSEKQET